MLTRSRLFAAAGADSTILTFDAFDGYAHEESLLRETGRLVERVQLRNIYDDHRNRDWADDGPGGEKLPPLKGHTSKQEFYPDGTPWRIAHKGKETVHDYQRNDGSVFLRVPADLVNRPDQGRGRILRVGRRGRVLGTFRDAGEWFRQWVDQIRGGGAQPTFLMLEDFFLSHVLTPFDQPQVHEVLSVHVPHTNAPRRWDSTLNRKAAAAFNRLADVDAVVLLTERQREDVQARYGMRNHLVTIPNPVEVPDRPDPAPERDPARFMVIARLDPGKRIDQAIDAFAAVHKDHPDARLEIAGDGPERVKLERHILALGLTGAVTMLGHDPHARDRLWSASGLLLTTAYEAFGLVVLEAMSRECPVVSYDVKYGPRELLEGNDCGFVIPDGDVAGIEAAMRRLLGDTELVARLGTAGRRAARAYTADHVLNLWADALDDAVARRPERVVLRTSGLTIHSTELVELEGSGRRGLTASRWLTKPSRPQGELQLVVDITVHAEISGAPGWREDLTVWMEAVHVPTGRRTALPTQITDEQQGAYRIRAALPVRLLCDEPAAIGEYRIRVGVTCRNAGWANYLVRPSEGPVQELYYDGHDRLVLRAGRF